jgi:hypothetical protein
MRKSKILKYSIVMVLVIGTAFYSCIPRVEEVEFTSYNNRFKNHLGITVNTKRGLFQGRESFLSFKRDNYSITMLVKGKAYAAQDMDITVYGKEEITLTPKNGTVIIEDQGPNSLVVKVTLNDDRIPKLINGTYLLSVAESTSDHVWYKMKR